MSDYLTKDQILSAKDIVSEDVKVPEWGGTVKVQALNGKERDQYEQSLIEQSADGKTRKINTEGARARLAALAIRNQEGKRLFDVASVEQLNEKSGAALERVIRVAQRLSGMDEDAVKGAVDDLKETQPAVSHSA